jgi:hypothetical protein
MGQLSKPIMTPVGVAYRSFHDTDANALKAAQWAVKLFGGQASAFQIIGPGRKGYYEAAILATVPETATCLAKDKSRDTSWHGTPEHAYVLFDDLETPIGLYFHKKGLFLKLKAGIKPFYDYGELSLVQ